MDKIRLFLIRHLLNRDEAYMLCRSLESTIDRLQAHRAEQKTADYDNVTCDLVFYQKLYRIFYFKDYK